MAEANTAAHDPVLIWGAGAIGGVVAGYLSRAGAAVVAVDADAGHVAAILRDGLQVEGPIDNFTVRLPAFAPNAVEGRYGRIFLCVKAQHTEPALQQLLPHLAEDGYVLSLQNGLNERVIARRAGEARTLGALVNFAADYLEPGRIFFGGRGAVVVGELESGVSPRVLALVELLRLFEPDVQATDNLWGYKWGKLGFGALLFATALTDETMVACLARPDRLPLWRALAGEIMQVARAAGVRPRGFNGFDPEAFAPGVGAAQAQRSVDAMTAELSGWAKQKSGVWRDLAVRKRKTEAEAQIGEIVRTAEALGRDAPVTRALIAMIAEIENGTRGFDSANLDLLLERAHATRASE